MRSRAQRRFHQGVQHDYEQALAAPLTNEERQTLLALAAGRYPDAAVARSLVARGYVTARQQPSEKRPGFIVEAFRITEAGHRKLSELQRRSAAPNEGGIAPGSEKKRGSP